MSIFSSCRPRTGRLEPKSKFGSVNVITRRRNRKEKKKKKDGGRGSQGPASVPRELETSSHRILQIESTELLCVSPGSSLFKYSRWFRRNCFITRSNTRAAPGGVMTRGGGGAVLPPPPEMHWKLGSRQRNLPAVAHRND